MSRNFTGARIDDTWYPAALANHLHGSDMSTTVEMVANFNEDEEFYFGIDGDTPDDSYDFVTVVLHEIVHGLGYVSSAQADNTNGIYGFQGFPLIYDRYVENNFGQNLTIFPIGELSSDLHDFLVSENLRWNGTDEAENAKLHAPDPFDPTSSISHLDVQYVNTSNALLTPGASLGEAIHNIGKISAAMLRDMGWEARDIVGIEDEFSIHGFDIDCYEHPNCDDHFWELLGEPKQEYSLGESGFYGCRFIDEDPRSPIYHYDWKLEILHADGRFLFDSGNSPINQHFDILIDDLPGNYQWERNFNGLVEAELTAFGRDVNSHPHEVLLPIAINYQPNIPDVEIFLESKTDCSVVTLSFYAPGATSYNVIYQSPAMPFSILEQVPIGQFTYTISNLDESLDYGFVVEGLNSSGGSLSAPLVRRKCKTKPKGDPRGPKYFSVSSFPNPITNYLHISSNNEEIIKKIEIYKLSTQNIVSSFEVSASSASLNLSSLESGLYSYRVTDENGQINNQIFIKN